MKKTLIFLAVTAIALLAGSGIFAASGINPNEQKVLDTFAAGFQVGNQTVCLAPEEILHAKNFFLRDDVDFTAADAQAFIDGHNKIAAVLQQRGVTKITDLTNGDLDKILAYAKEAALAVKSMNIAFAYDDSTKMASVVNRDNNAILAASDVTPESTIIKQTGTGLGSVYGTAAAGIVLFGGAVINARKNQLFRKKEK